MSGKPYIGVRADKALELLGEKGPMRMSALLDALGIRTKVAASFKITVSKLVDAGILSVTDDHDTLVSLTDQKYADPAVALDEYRAYNSEREESREEDRDQGRDNPPGQAFDDREHRFRNGRTRSESMKYRLKDRELQRKLDELSDGDFSARLHKERELIKDSFKKETNDLN